MQRLPAQHARQCNDGKSNRRQTPGRCAGRWAPDRALATIVGIDRFMSEWRAVTNIIGNSVATLVVARREGDLDMQRLEAELPPPR